MSIQYINTGTSPNKGDGDSIRVAFTKINQNFAYSDVKIATTATLGQVRLGQGFIINTQTGVINVAGAVNTGDIVFDGSIITTVNDGEDITIRPGANAPATLVVQAPIYQGNAFNGIVYPDTMIRADADVDSYAQVILQNHSTGVTASTDLVIMNDQGTDVSNFIDLGINGTNYTNAEYGVTLPGDGYLFVNGGNLAIGTQTPDKVLRFHAGGTTTTNAGGFLTETSWNFNRPINITQSVNGDLEVMLMNSNTGSNARSMVHIESDGGNYLHFGINSSNKTEGSIGPNEAFIHTVGTGATLHIGNTSTINFYADRVLGHNGIPAVRINSLEGQRMVVDGNILPHPSDPYSLGTATSAWNGLYVNDIYINGAINTSSLTVNGAGTFITSLSLGNNIIYDQGVDGFSVNENVDIAVNTVNMAYHFDAGPDKDATVIGLGKTGFYHGYIGATGDVYNNTLVFAAEGTNTDFEFRNSSGFMDSLSIVGGNQLLSITRDGKIKFGNSVSTGIITANTNSDITIVTTNGVTTGTWVFDTSSNLTVPGHIIPEVDMLHDLGTPTKQWRHIYVSTGSIYLGDVKLTNINGSLDVKQVNYTVNVDGEIENETTVKPYSITSIDRVLSSNGDHTLLLDNDGLLTLDGQPFGNTFININLTGQGSPIDYFAGPEVSFVKTDYGSEVDDIDTDLSITRDQQRGIYNAALEPGWDNTQGDPNGLKSPIGTVWNSQGWTDLTNLDQRTYVSFYDAVGGNIGNNVLPPKFIMKDVANNTYYKIDFTVWGNYNNGAPVTYTREQVDPVTGNSLSGITTFVKPGYSDPFLVYDDISTQVKISRANQYGIFNIAQEAQWNSNSPGDGDGMKSPQGTLWNLEGWHNLESVKDRTYDSLYNAFGGNLGNQIIGVECVMHDTINDKYYTVKFTSWTAGGNGGGFSYVRRLINSDILFVHSTNGSEIDTFVADDPPGTGVGITRGSNQGIYNPYQENSWNGQVSPAGTLWNGDGWDDISDLQTRTFIPFFEVFGYGGLGAKITGRELIMKVESTGEYYKIKFTYWQQGGGGGFKYFKSLINTNDLVSGIRFADGTLQKTAAKDVVKFTAPGQRSIQEWCGYNVVDYTPGQEEYSTGTVQSTVINSSSINVNVPSALFDDMNGYSNHPVREIYLSLDNGSTWNKVECYGGGGYPTRYVYLEEETNAQVFTANVGAPARLRYMRGGEPVVWFDPTYGPGPASYFRGAVIDYHSNTNAGTMIGQIVISVGNGNYHVTHTESTSGNNDMNTVNLWHTGRLNTALSLDEGKLAFYRTDTSTDRLRIQWRATMFYGMDN